MNDEFKDQTIRDGYVQRSDSAENADVCTAADALQHPAAAL